MINSVPKLDLSKLENQENFSTPEKIPVNIDNLPTYDADHLKILMQITPPKDEIVEMKIRARERKKRRFQDLKNIWAGDETDRSTFSNMLSVRSSISSIQKSPMLAEKIQRLLKDKNLRNKITCDLNTSLDEDRKMANRLENKTKALRRRSSSLKSNPSVSKKLHKVR